MTENGPGLHGYFAQRIKNLSQKPTLLHPAAKSDACVVGQQRSQRGENHVWRAFLTCRLGLELSAQPRNDQVTRIGSKCTDEEKCINDIADEFSMHPSELCNILHDRQ